MRVVYIVGTSHSGSSLLSLMLNAHPEIISVGELIDLNRRFALPVKARYRACGCGASSLSQCEFWSRVDAVARQTEGKSLVSLDVLNYQERDNAWVFRAVAKTSLKRFVVDASKRPTRLAYLLQLKGLDVYPIHLVREPKGQISSMARKNGGLVRHILQYERTHGNIRRILKSVPHCVVRYEDLVLQPEDTLSRVLAPLGLEFNSQQLLWSKAPQHTIAGNNMRWHPDRLVLDERWKQQLTRFQQLAVQLGTIRARRHLARTHD